MATVVILGEVCVCGDDGGYVVCVCVGGGGVIVVVVWGWGGG